VSAYVVVREQGRNGCGGLCCRGVKCLSQSSMRMTTAFCRVAKWFDQQPRGKTLPVRSKQTDARRSVRWLNLVGLMKMMSADCVLDLDGLRCTVFASL
jgi:hypothetical protein